MFIVIKRNKLLLIFVSILLFLILCSSFINYLCITINARYSVKDPPEYKILILIEEKKLYLFNGVSCIKRYPIASGKAGWPSPIGDWKITGKGDWGEGFGGRWLGLNVLWGTYGIHGTTEPSSIGRAASHGCIRMFSKDVMELYDIVPVGTPVIIRNGPYGPFGTGFKDLTPGDRGADVLAIQKRLKELGYFSGKETGIYEDDLKRAVYKFQEDHNLKVKYTITHADYVAMGFTEFE